MTLAGGYDGPNPFDLLGLTPDATDAEISAAWKRQLKYWHPDRRGAEGEARTKLINRAYQELQDPMRRSRYADAAGNWTGTSAPPPPPPPAPPPESWASPPWTPPPGKGDRRKASAGPGPSSSSSDPTTGPTWTPPPGPGSGSMPVGGGWAHGRPGDPPATPYPWWGAPRPSKATGLRRGIPAVRGLLHLLAGYATWLVHPQTHARERAEVVGEVATRVGSVLGLGLLVALAWLVVLPILYIVFLTLVLLGIALISLALGLYLLGFRWNFRRRRRY